MTTEYVYRVILSNIDWDIEGYEEEPQSVGLPDSYVTVVEATDENEAVYYAMEEVGEDQGFLINDADSRVDNLGTYDDFMLERIQTSYTAMKRFGGGFMQSLADALIKADLTNAKIILNAWGGQIQHLTDLQEGATK